MYSEIIIFIREKPTLFEGSLCLDREEIGQSIDRHLWLHTVALSDTAEDVATITYPKPLEDSRRQVSHGNNPAHGRELFGS